jgi:DNA-directed RNA polymerase
VASRVLVDHSLDELDAWAVAGWPAEEVLDGYRRRLVQPSRQVVTRLLEAIDTDDPPDTLVDLLDDHHGFVPMKDFNYRVAVPAKYLAGHLWRELNAVVSPCMVVKAWLNKTVRKALSQNIPLEWTSPSGLPMRVADRMITTTKVETMLYGVKRSLNMADAPLDAKLDATAANRAACANFVHQMDAAYLTLVTDQLAERHIPVVTNHDCFATSPAHASELHNLLLTTFSGLYRTDWLAVMREEMQARTGLSLPKLPVYGELCPGEIGNNPYVFS